MKGLLLKDWYMMKKYCRVYLLLTIVFMAVSFVNAGNMFLVFYPCLLCGMIPVSLLAYDEQSRWTLYSATLPYTKSQIVSSKYLIGLFIQLTVLILTGVVQGIQMIMHGSFRVGDFGVLLLVLMSISTFSSAIALPFVFKLGVEKGRTAYYVMIGVCCGAMIAASELFEGSHTVVQSNYLLIIIAMIGVGIYALSWWLAIKFYKKREL